MWSSSTTTSPAPNSMRTTSQNLNGLINKTSLLILSSNLSEYSDCLQTKRDFGYNSQDLILKYLELFNWQ
ncbi:hypothetical protein WDU94_012480 [Cyamophila willieti]